MPQLISFSVTLEIKQQMPPSLRSVLLLFTLLAPPALTSARPTKALVTPISKDDATSLHSITLNRNKKFVIDLGLPFSWHRCSKRSHNASSRAAQCSVARSYGPPRSCRSTESCRDNNQCGTACPTFPSNPITRSCSASRLTFSNVDVSATDGRNPLATVKFKKVYLSCAPDSLFRSLPHGVSGMASLSPSPLSFPSQFSSKVKKQFAICLPSSSQSDGVAFFGSGPFFLLPPPGRNITNLLQFTPLLKKSPPAANPSDYYIGVKGIAINLNAVRLPKDARKLGVKISTVVPYTKLRSRIYRAFVDRFVFETRGIPRASKVEPFDYCLNTTNLGSTRVGLPVPQIDLQLSDGKNWTIFSSNSMKRVKDDVACLAFVDGGDKAEQDVVIGSFQIEHNFLLFDLVNSRLGFTSTLLFFQTTCSNFNFTSGV